MQHEIYFPRGKKDKFSNVFYSFKCNYDQNNKKPKLSNRKVTDDTDDGSIFWTACINYLEMQLSFLGLVFKRKGIYSNVRGIFYS